MGQGRFVVLGLAHPRTEWFRRVAQWANAATLPMEFVKCLSPEELRARLASGRPHSAVLIDADLPAADRDLFATCADARCAAIAVEGGRAGQSGPGAGRLHDWVALGAAVTLRADFDRGQLLDVLAEYGRPISPVDAIADPGESAPLSPWRGVVVTVLGPGGTGASTVAIAAAQALASDVRYGGSVALLDACREAEQAMLHDCGAVTPGVQELVESHRNGRPAAQDVRRLAFDIPERGYELVLGLRRSRFWTSIRPAAFRSAFASMASVWQALVVDTDADLEGEDDGGSIDVEERNVMARTAVSEADVVLAVGHPTMKGLHALTRLLVSLQEHGVRAERVVPVLNESARTPRARASAVRVLEDLLPAWHDVAAPPAVFLPVRPIDRLMRDGSRLPRALVDPLHAALIDVLATQNAACERILVPAQDRFFRVRPGTLGSYSEADLDEEAG